jgi:hypothetical protein
MSYHEHDLDLSDAQMQRLARCEGVRLKHDQMGCGDRVHLTAAQIRRVGQSMKGGKGLVLSMTPAQLDHHRVYGTGRFGDFLRSIGNKIKDVALGGVKFLGNKLVDKATSYGESKLQGLVGRIGLPDSVSSSVSGALSDGVKYGNEATKGELANFLSGLSSSKHGTGLFDFLGPNVGGFLNNLGNTALRVGTDVATRAIVNKLGGGLKSGMKRHTSAHGKGVEYGNSRSRAEMEEFFKGMMTTKKGKGLFDFLGSDVGGFLNSLGNGALNVAGDIATGVIKKKLGGGMCPKCGCGLVL